MRKECDYCGVTMTIRATLRPENTLIGFLCPSCKKIYSKVYNHLKTKFDQKIKMLTRKYDILGGYDPKEIALVIEEFANE